MSFLSSPGVHVREIDLTNVVPSVATKSIHQIRHTYATNAENSYEAKDLLQNRTVGVIDKHYRQKDFENSLRLADKQSKIARYLLH